MADERAADRTEQPTAKRREKAREEGQVAISPEIAPVAVLLAGLAVASWGAPEVVARSRAVLHAWLAAVGPMALREDGAGPPVVRAALELGSLLVPFGLAMAVVGAGVMLAQVGWVLTPQRLAPDPTRLGFAHNLGRFLSADGAVELLKALLKIAVVLGLAYRVIVGGGRAAMGTPAMSVEAILAMVGAQLHHLVLVVVLALGALGALDYLWQRRRHEDRLKMTRQEVKDEHKESEGNPQVRGRFRKAHKALARRRMLGDVARADIVLTNPVHVAVALRYRAEEMGAPRVLAKGAGELAERIKEAARRAGVPIVERRALARALFRTVEVGAEIPPTLYRAVAEILAYIYAVRGRRPQEAR
ncbi:MAG TPA: EscU/YscU/HrcU family type III secretion system export apparatus switch protein [Candidatus Binatia bacterium]|nr:EscU/YscU/HrcU family type III secretion system export apparatus switch protein [Candidatus Binatia bacterium]